MQLLIDDSLAQSECKLLVQSEQFLPEQKLMDFVPGNTFLYLSYYVVNGVGSHLWTVINRSNAEGALVRAAPGDIENCKWSVIEGQNVLMIVKEFTGR